MAFDANTVIESYADYLFSVRKRLWDRFQRTRKNAPESALAEAVVFRVLQYCKVNPAVADIPNSGGPDFLCAGTTADGFMVEATSFLPEKVTRDTGIKNEFPREISGGPIALLTPQIAEKADEKRSQFEKLSMPGVLAIASSHFGAPIVLDAVAAQYALVSTPFWTGSEARMTLDFASSLFLRMENDGSVVSKNRNLSAVLLVSVAADRSYVSGALNPAAACPLRSSLLWMINFAYLKDWPIENGRVRCAWTMGNQPGYEVPHGSIRFSNTDSTGRCSSRSMK
jgi:hypothetical protein